VAGLPELISSSPTPRGPATTEIGRRIAPFDLVNVQEDFNYHARLYAANAHPYRTPTSGGVPFGSGLNSLSNFSYDDPDFERVKWSNCSSGSGDCLTPKGFTFMRVRLADGVYVDVYNLHTDAGDDAGDLAARAANLGQLTSFIRSHSAGNAVLVMGDTNTRYTRAGDTIAEFAADNQLTDAWVQLPRGGVAPAKGSPTLGCDKSNPTDDCEIVDKVLYRGSRFINLNATTYHNEHAKFLEDGTGKMLSDHFPLAVGFSWSTNPAYQFSEQFGGPHGDYFNDVDRVARGAKATEISLRSGTTVWFWKIAYAEEVARASPGVQLTLDVTEQLLARPDVLRADSCATADHPMIDHLWRERLALADLLIAPSAAGMGQFRIARHLETLRRALIASAKRARDVRG